MRHTLTLDRAPAWWQAAAAPPPAEHAMPTPKPLKTYVRDFVHCTRCNRLDLLKPDTWPDGTRIPCPGCGAGNALRVEPHDIQLLPAPLCKTCKDAPLIFIFLPEHTTARRPPCANCQRPDAAATVRLYVVRRFRHHGYTACQVVARHRPAPQTKKAAPP